MTTDRDGSIERLLRQALPPDAHGVSRDDCPDAETLAALADDTLTAAARREVDTHIADCHRCQAMTAAMVRAGLPASGPADEAAGAVPAWRRRAFNWLVPAAAAATAIALWVLIPGQRMPMLEQSAPEPQAAVAAQPQRQVDAAPLQSEVITEEPLRLPPEMLANGGERDANVAQEKTAPAAPAVSAPAAAAAVAGGLLPSRDPAADRGQAAATTPPAAARQEARSLQETVSASAPLSRDASANPAPAAAPPPPPAVTVTAERPLPPQEQRRAAAAAPPAPAAPAALAALGASAAPRRASSIFEVVSPDPRIRWNVGPNPVVQYSADGGATWTGQQTGAPAAFTAGSAPAPGVCWLVGRGGLVLRTTDGGRQWERVAFPETVDLTDVIASTALNATVSLPDGRRLATTDGGRSWAAATQ